MSDWPVKRTPEAWCPDGETGLLAVHLPKDGIISTWTKYKGLLGTRVDWLASREPDALTILMDVFQSVNHVWLTVSGVREREWVGTNLMEDDLVGDTLIAMVGVLPGKVTSDPEAVTAIQETGLEEWAMLLRSAIRYG